MSIANPLPPVSSHDADGRRGTVERGLYLIDRFRVAYEFGGGWKCSCAEFASREACKHTREAAGRRAAQARIALHLKRGSGLALAFDESPPVAVIRSYAE